MKLTVSQHNKQIKEATRAANEFTYTGSIPKLLPNVHPARWRAMVKSIITNEGGYDGLSGDTSGHADGDNSVGD